MSRQFISLLLSSVLVFGSVTTSAFSAPAATGTATRANESPLPAGGAAGIKQAQGFDNPALAAGIVVGIFLIGVLLLQDDDDDDDGPATTGT